MGVKPLVVLLHGFLGQPQDWPQDLQTPGALIPEAPCLIPDLHLDPTWNFEESFDPWVKKFWIQIDRLAPTSELLLAGYSLGGRLALQAFAARPERVRSFVALSVNPGLSEDDQNGRQERIRQDEAWAKRFEQENWSAVMKAWNSQPVFQGDGHPPERQESGALRKAAAQALRGASLGRQIDFRPFLKSHSERIEWLVGERDSKFVTLGRELELQQDLRVRVMPGCGHRLLVDLGQGRRDGGLGGLLRAFWR